ncbi:HEAT repeat domain-containing protein [Kribbella pittospori]|nr:HEAT repeat domain-containing protein [Kribbella pittospori]
MRLFRRQKTVSVPDRYGFGDGDTIEVPARPDAARLFDDADESEHTRLAVGYLNHPDPAVRLAAVQRAPGIATVAVVEELVDRLADDDPAVRAAAVAANWEIHGDSDCERPVLILRDEIRGHTRSWGVPSTEALRLGKDRAVQALGHLVAGAPDDDARARLQAFIDEEVVLPDTVAADPDLVLEFIEKVQRSSEGQVATYEAYRAANRTEALAYLNAHPVTEPFYYLEVETPEGNFGRDIKGIYDL